MSDDNPQYNILSAQSSKITDHSLQRSTLLDHDEVIARSILTGLVDNVARQEGRRFGGLKNAGKKRQSYPAFFKAQAINEIEIEGMMQVDAAEKYGVDQAQISRWLKNRVKIMRDAADSHRKLFRKGRKSTKHQALYEELWIQFRTAREKGHIVNFASLFTKARTIQKRLDPNAEVKNHMIVRFLQKYKIRIRAKQRNKKRAKTE